MNPLSKVLGIAQEEITALIGYAERGVVAAESIAESLEKIAAEAEKSGEAFRGSRHWG